MRLARRKSALRHTFTGRGTVLARFRIYNIALLAVAFFIMTMALLFVLYNVAWRMSHELVSGYAATHADSLNARLSSQTTLLESAARSPVVVNWLSDENNEERKQLAHQELLAILPEPYTHNLRVVFSDSLNEYAIRRHIPARNADGLWLFGALTPNALGNAWYFYALASDEEHTLTVGWDRAQQRERVWLNSRVVRDGVVLGVISMGLEFSNIAVSPIRLTDRSVAILYDSLPLDMQMFLPITAAMVVMMLTFALISSIISFKLIFGPLDQLIYSLKRLKDDKNVRIYGLERHDEFGHLSNTIQDLFTQAYYDVLTGIRNRRSMETQLKQAMEFLARPKGTLSLLMIDVDYFKKYNDTYGHDKGDACLHAVAQVLASCTTRSNDFVARYGGEEFVVVLPNTGEAGARIIAQKLLGTVRSLNIPHSASPAASYVTISIGITTGIVTHKQYWTDYVKRADEALYISKRDGRNKYTFLNFAQNRVQP